MRYINSYENDAAIQAAVDNGELGKPYVALNTERDEIDWNSKKETDYSTIPLTFKILSGGFIRWKSQSEYLDGKVIQYNKNNTGWNSITAKTSSIINVSDGDIIQFRGNNTSYGGSTFANSTAQFKVYGNIMSLINSTNFATLTTFNSNTSVFSSMFSNCTGLTDASKLILPVTTLTNNCYSSMFKGCTNLNYIKCLATNISASNCTLNWLQGVSPTGTFVKKAGVTWPSGASGIPSGWTVVEE